MDNRCHEVTVGAHFMNRPSQHQRNPAARGRRGEIDAVDRVAVVTVQLDERNFAPLRITGFR
jgi:hypothetical protein